MARSKKKGVAPAASDEKKRDTLNREEGDVHEARGSNAVAGSARKTRSKGGPEKKRRDDREKTGVAVDVDGDEDEGSTAGTKGAQAKNNRHILRDNVMKEVLTEYHAKPVARADVPVRQLVWPFFGLRKLLGWAHVTLHDAVLDGNIAVVKATLLRYIRKCPAKINEHDEEGRTALSLALLEQREDIADLIISIDDTNINAPDTITGLSPLHNAVLLDLGSSTQKLAFRGADTNAVDQVGMTPLMLACRLGHESMVDMLVNVFGAEIDPADKAGWTCLFYATYHNESSIVQYLLMHGADLDHKDKRGMTAVDWGEHMGHGETCAIFSSFESQLAL